MNRRLVRGFGGLVGVATLAAGVVLVPALESSTARAEEGPPPEVAERRVLTTEHVDAINVGLAGQELAIDSRISPPVEYVDSESLVFHLSDLGHVDALPAPFVEFIGSDEAWVIPQVQNSDVLWAGWSTEDIAPGEVDGDAVDITLADVRGPGDVEVWQTVGFGDVRRIFSSDEEYKTLTQAVNAHVHANWAFTEPGVYTVTFVASASVNGEEVQSQPVDFTWVVGGDTGVLPERAASTTVLGVPATAQPGGEVPLTATVDIGDIGADAPPAPGGYVQFHQGDESLGWAGLVDGEATLTTTFEEAGQYQVTATYTAQEPQFYAASVSEPVVIDVREDSGDESGGDVSGGDESGGDESGGDEAGGDEAGGDESGGDEAGGDEAGGDEAGGDEAGGDESGPNPPDQCEDPRTLLTDEHVDLLTPALTGNELSLQAKVGTSASHTFYEPGDLLVQVKDPEAATRVPGGAEFEFLGEPGDAVWIVPQTQDPDLVWAGWSTEELKSGDFDGDAVSMALHDVEGPGELEVFQSGSLSNEPLRIFSSQDDLEARAQSVGQHVHANWAFTALGEYTLTFEVSGRLTDGTELSTGPVDYTFVVGDPACDPDRPGNEAGGDTGGATGSDDGTDAGGAAHGGDAAGAHDGADSGGDVSNGDAVGNDAAGNDAAGGDAAGGDDGTDAGTESGGDDAGAAGSDTAEGNDAGTNVTGGATGADGGDDPKPTTQPTNGVCPEGMVPAGSRPTATATDDGSAGGDGAQAGAAGEQDGDGNVGNDDGSGPDDGDDSGDEDDNPGGGTQDEQAVLTDEHVDLLSPRLRGSDLSLETKVGSANDHTFYAPADVLVQVKPEAETTVPSGGNHAFLGDAGDPIWLIPETQNPEIVWAGWSTEELSSGDFQGDAVDIRMIDVQGPGTLEVFQTTGFGDVSRIFSSTDSLQPRRQSVGQHVHANWAFSAEGEYTVTFEVSGALASGDRVTTGPVQYSFVVGQASDVNAAAAQNNVSGSSETLPDTGAAPAAVAPALSAADATDSDCVLASTGTSGISGAVTFGGTLLVLGGAAAFYAYRRRGRGLTSVEHV